MGSLPSEKIANKRETVEARRKNDSNEEYKKKGIKSMVNKEADRKGRAEGMPP